MKSNGPIEPDRLFSRAHQAQVLDRRANFPRISSPCFYYVSSSYYGSVAIVVADVGARSWCELIMASVKAVLPFVRPRSVEETIKRSRQTRESSRAASSSHSHRAFFPPRTALANAGFPIVLVRVTLRPGPHRLLSDFLGIREMPLSDAHDDCTARPLVFVSDGIRSAITRSTLGYASRRGSAVGVNEGADACSSISRAHRRSARTAGR